MKRIIIVLTAALLLPCMPAMAVPAPDKAYQDIMTLSSSGVIPEKPAKAQITRDEALILVESGVKNVTAGNYGASKAELETLYGLVKMFTTDMMEKGKDLGEIEDILVDLRMRSESSRMKNIEDKQEAISGTIGLKINGDASVNMVDLLLTGNAFPLERDYRPVTQYIDLIFSAHQSDKLSAEAVFRIESLFGSYWSAMNIYGVRKLNIHGNYPVSFDAGVYQAKLTPLTLWAVDDDRPFEAAFFKNKRDMIKKELYLEDEMWPLTGLKLASDFKLFGETQFNAALMAARIAVANDTSTTSYASYVNAPSYSASAGALYTCPHDRYMLAGRLSTDLSFKDKVTFGLNAVEITDIKETGLIKMSPSMSNLVASADAEVKVFDWLKLKGEYAMSDYYVTTSQSAQVWNNRDNWDSALMAGLEAEGFGLKLDGSFRVNGDVFTSYAAQSRTYDGFANFAYLTENNTWNVSMAPPAFSLNNAAFPLTKYNASINGSYAATGKNLMPFVFYENNSMPYGGSTPNRQGLDVKIGGDYFGSAIMPSARYSYYQELVSHMPGSQATSPRTFQAVEGGIKSKLGNISAGAGYKLEMTENTSIGGQVELTAQIIDASFDYGITPKLGVHAGFKGNIFAGKDCPYTYTSGSGMAFGVLKSYDATILKWGLGVDYEILKQATARLSFAHTYFTDNLESSNNFTAQEIDLSAVMTF